MLPYPAATIRARLKAAAPMTSPPLRVLIAEDNADLRDLLVTLVSAEPDLKCVGTADDVDAVIAHTAEHKADVLVLDLELQGRSSIDVLKTVREIGRASCRERV